MSQRKVSDRVLRRLKELLSIKELNDAPFIKNKVEDVETLWLRKKKRLDYSNKYSEEVKERIYSGMGFGRWSYEEHKNFIIGIFQFGNKWKEIVNLIKTRNCIQARSHSQKFFFKLFKFAETQDMEHYVNLKNLFSFGKEIGEEKLSLLKDFLIKAYDQLENGEQIDYFKNNLLVQFLKKLEKNKEARLKELLAAQKVKKFKNEEFKKIKQQKIGNGSQKEASAISETNPSEKRLLKYFYIEKVKNKRASVTISVAENKKFSQQEKIFNIEKHSIKKHGLKIQITNSKRVFSGCYLTEDTTNSYKLNEAKVCDSINLFEYNNFSLVETIGNLNFINFSIRIYFFFKFFYLPIFYFPSNLFHHFI